MIFLGVYDEWELATSLIPRLIKLTNECILVRTDGTWSDKFSSFYSSFIVEHPHRILTIRGKERLKVKGKGGALCHQVLNSFFFTNLQPYLIKIDPDTGINHAPTVPTEFDVASNYSSQGYLLGGAIAFSRSAIQAIVESSLLLDEKYKSLRWCYRWRDREWIPCEDAILYDVIQRLGLNLVDWEDVYCCHSQQPFNPPRPLEHYSLYHPVRRKDESIRI